MSSLSAISPARAAAGLGTASLLLLAASPAEAHIVSSRLGDFYAGALHPLMALEDLVQWLALGLLAGMQDPKRGRWVVAGFPLGLLAGVALTHAGLLPAPPRLFDGGGMVVLGLLLALAIDLPAAAVAGLAVLLGVARGSANIDGLDAANDVVLFGAGMLLSGYAAATLISAATLAFRRNGAGWRRIAVRAAGSWIAAVGCMLLAFALRAGVMQ